MSTINVQPTFIQDLAGSDPGTWSSSSALNDVDASVASINSTDGADPAIRVNFPATGLGDATVTGVSAGITARALNPGGGLSTSEFNVELWSTSPSDGPFGTGKLGQWAGASVATSSFTDQTFTLTVSGTNFATAAMLDAGQVYLVLRHVPSVSPPERNDIEFEYASLTVTYTTGKPDATYPPKTDLEFWFTDKFYAYHYKNGVLSFNRDIGDWNDAQFGCTFRDGRVLVVDANGPGDGRGTLYTSADFSDGGTPWAIPDGPFNGYINPQDGENWFFDSPDAANGCVYDPTLNCVWEVVNAEVQGGGVFPDGDRTLAKWSVEGQLLGLFARVDDGAETGDDRWVSFREGYRGMALDDAGRKIYAIGAGSNQNYSLYVYDIAEDEATGYLGAFEQFPGTGSALPAEAAGVHVGVYSAVGLGFDSGTGRLIATPGTYWYTGDFVVSDTFSRADANDPGMTEVGPKFWNVERFSGDNPAIWQTESGGILTQVTAGQSFCTVRCSDEFDGTMVVTVDDIGNGTGGAVFRYGNTVNYFAVSLAGTFFKIREGAFTSFGSTSALANGDEISFVGSGASVDAYKNGVLIGNGTDDSGYYTDSQQLEFGFYGFAPSPTGARWTDFSFTASGLFQTGTDNYTYAVAYDVASLNNTTDMDDAWYTQISGSYVLTGDNTDVYGPYNGPLFDDFAGGAIAVLPDGSGMLYPADGEARDIFTEAEFDAWVAGGGSGNPESDFPSIWHLDFASGVISPVPLPYTGFYNGRHGGGFSYIWFGEVAPLPNLTGGITERRRHFWRSRPSLGQSD